MASLPSSKTDAPPRADQVEEAVDGESRPRATPREEKRKKGGYECEFVEPPDSKLLQSECSICLGVLREPHIVSCCGHSFCETCIGRIQRDGKPCPLCNEPGFSTMANKGLKRTLNEFQVRCPHRELGCEWVGELGKLDQHLNADPQPERQLEGCQFTSVECIHCKDHMRRQVIAGHQNERCPKRPYECQHHVKEECPLTAVECDLHYAGCGVKLPCKDMAVHMKEESVAHISLLAAENQRLAKQLLERDGKMQQLMQQNTELSHRIDQQQEAIQELRQELARTKDEQCQQQEARQGQAENVILNKNKEQFTRVGAQVEVKWSADDLGDSGWEPGWYAAIVQGYDYNEDILMLQYVSQPDLMYRTKLTPVLTYGTIRLV